MYYQLEVGEYMLEKIFKGLIASMVILCVSISVAALIGVLSYLCPILLLIVTICGVLYLGYEIGNRL